MKNDDFGKGGLPGSGSNAESDSKAGKTPGGSSANAHEAPQQAQKAQQDADAVPLGGPPLPTTSAPAPTPTPSGSFRKPRGIKDDSKEGEEDDGILKVDVTSSGRPGNLPTDPADAAKTAADEKAALGIELNRKKANEKEQDLQDANKKAMNSRRPEQPKASDPADDSIEQEGAKKSPPAPPMKEKDKTSGRQDWQELIEMILQAIMDALEMLGGTAKNIGKGFIEAGKSARDVWKSDENDGKSTLSKLGLSTGEFLKTSALRTAQSPFKSVSEHTRGGPLIKHYAENESDSKYSPIRWLSNNVGRNIARWGTGYEQKEKQQKESNDPIPPSLEGEDEKSKSAPSKLKPSPSQTHTNEDHSKNKSETRKDSKKETGASGSEQDSSPLQSKMAAIPSPSPTLIPTSSAADQSKPESSAEQGKSPGIQVGPSSPNPMRPTPGPSPMGGSAKEKDGDGLGDVEELAGTAASMGASALRLSPVADPTATPGEMGSVAAGSQKSSRFQGALSGDGGIESQLNALGTNGSGIVPRASANDGDALPGIGSLSTALPSNSPAAAGMSMPSPGSAGGALSRPGMSMGSGLASSSPTLTPQFNAQTAKANQTNIVDIAQPKADPNQQNRNKQLGTLIEFGADLAMGNEAGALAKLAAGGMGSAQSLMSSLGISAAAGGGLAGLSGADRDFMSDFMKEKVGSAIKNKLSQGMGGGSDDDSDPDDPTGMLDKVFKELEKELQKTAKSAAKSAAKM